MDIYDYLETMYPVIKYVG